MTNETDEPVGVTATQHLQRWLPLALSLLVLAYLLMGVQRAGKPEGLARFDYDAFGKIAVSEDGRVKPIDTVARNALLMISGKQSLKDEMLLPGDNGVEQPAVVWYAELVAGLPESNERRVIRIDDPEVLGLLGKTTEDGKYYALNDFFSDDPSDPDAPFFQVGRLAEQALQVRDDQRTRFQDHIIGLRQKLGTIAELRTMLSPFVAAPAEAGQEWEPVVRSRNAAPEPSALDRPTRATWFAVAQALGENNPDAFNAAVAEHQAVVSAAEPGPSRKAAFERGFNRYAPFAKGVALYVLAGILGLAAMLLRSVLPVGWYTALWRSGLGILVVTFLLHTAALIVRIWLQGRPPVTNLYSSAVFIGWALVGGAILLEKITKLGVASFAASAGGVATLIVAHNLAKDGDTMGVMVAVLDSNFWLATHVITITLGYSATFLAGFIAIVYIVLGMCTPVLDRKAGRAMAGMVYATVCFAIVFSFVGTVLGGIWADQSWGRFWGWDPKENGAILIVLMNAIILHARWGHLIKERGLMVLAVGGNIITAWSWFGTNLLGVGLHSYGFMDGAMYWLAGFAASQMLIMAVALMVPVELWWSFRRPSKPGVQGADSTTSRPDPAGAGA